MTTAFSGTLYAFSTRVQISSISSESIELVGEVPLVGDLLGFGLQYAGYQSAEILDVHGRSGHWFSPRSCVD
ncbi:hypothetical protein OG524_03480 [Streptomyces sp. NBC_01520]|uniref:hypothetical protein n=1 Tax=Streptomyces sp. NBC_01520 TaxID=2903892 RepID=UPI0038659117